MRKTLISSELNSEQMHESSSLIEQEERERIIRQRLQHNAHKVNKANKLHSESVKSKSISKKDEDKDGNGVPDKHEKGMSYASINKKINEIDDLQANMCYDKRQDVHDNMQADAMTANITQGMMNQRAEKVIDKHEHSHASASAVIKAAMAAGSLLLEAQKMLPDDGLPGDMFD